MSDIDIQPDTEISENRSPAFGPVTTTSTANGNSAGIVNSAAGAAGALAGWAISSLSKQLASSEVHSSLSASAALTNGSSTYHTPAASPRPSDDGHSALDKASSNVATFGSGSASSSRANLPNGSSPSRGMKLGGATAKKPQSAPKLADMVADEWEDGEVANAWGNEDLIDVNADADDWGESAPLCHGA